MAIKFLFFSICLSSSAMMAAELSMADSLACSFASLALLPHTLQAVAAKPSTVMMAPIGPPRKPSTREAAPAALAPTLVAAFKLACAVRWARSAAATWADTDACCRPRIASSASMAARAASATASSAVARRTVRSAKLWAPAADAAAIAASAAKMLALAPASLAIASSRDSTIMAWVVLSWASLAPEPATSDSSSAILAARSAALAATCSYVLATQLAIQIPIFALVSVVSRPISKPRLLANKPMPVVSAMTVPFAWARRPTNSSNSFFKTLKAPPMVWICLASSRSLSSALGNTSAMALDVISPLLAISFKAPIGTPRPSASAFIKRGAASLTALNSSPRSVPEANDCDSCSMADADSSLVAPLTLSARLTVSVILATWVCATPSSRVPLAMRAYSTPVAPRSAWAALAIRRTSAYACAYSRWDCVARRSWAVNLVY